MSILGAALLLASLGGCDKSRPSPFAATLPVASAPAPSVSVPASAPAGASAAPPAGPAKVTLEGRAMGTSVTFTAFTHAGLNQAQAEAALRKAMDEVRRLEGLMTTWRDDSEMSRVNAAAGKAPVHVGPETFEVVDKSVWASKLSGGAFDVTFEAMHGLWKFDQDLDPHPPAAAAVAERRAFIDYRHIALDAAAQTIFLDRAGYKMSLGGIAKGYAIDQAARILLAANVTDFFAQAGGDLYVHGVKPDGSPWIVGVRDPRGPEGSYFGSLPIRDHAFSTAGDYERAYVVAGTRYHHIIDPHTGYPATASRSVTIWAKDALTADAIDDAVFILGPEKGLALVESIEGCGAVIVDRANKVWVSKRLEGVVRIDREPTGGI